MLQLAVAEVPASRDHIENEMLHIRGEIKIRELYFSRLAAALAHLDATQEHAQEQTTIDWIRHDCRLTQQAAVDRVRIGQKLPQMPASEDALCNGEVGIQHLAVMARSAVAVGDAFDENKLLPLAKQVQMQVTSSLETMLGLLGSPGVETEFSLPVSSKTVERWACDCSITRVLMQESVPIDVGRAARVIKGPQRRALIARDKHCQWPGCERSASWCDGHHIVHWINGGGLELQNMVLLCQRHHWMATREAGRSSRKKMACCQLRRCTYSDHP